MGSSAPAEVLPLSGLAPCSPAETTGDDIELRSSWHAFRPEAASFLAAVRRRTMIDLTPFERLVALDHGLSVVVTCRADHTPQATVVNAGVVPHPLEDTRVVAFVSAGGSRKLHFLRADPTVAVVVRAGWR